MIKGHLKDRVLVNLPEYGFVPLPYLSLLLTYVCQLQSYVEFQPFFVYSVLLYFLLISSICFLDHCDRLYHFHYYHHHYLFLPHLLGLKVCHLEKHVIFCRNGKNINILLF
uniref:Ovule protein n=1 Tax=Schistosoma curassoni TaxID=6186 RepID=A0A183JP54_9TREM